MNAQQVVLDTSIVIDLLKNVPAVVNRFVALVDAGTRFLVSPIVVAEIYAGAFEREYKAIEALFDLCERTAMPFDTGRAAGRYAKQYAKAYQGIALEDYLLAATAKAYGCPLWTHNRKHFPMGDIELLVA